MEQKQKKNKKINLLREELSEVVREIGKIDDELSVTYDHKDFIFDLVEQLSSVPTKEKKDGSNVNEFESNFFLTDTKRIFNEDQSEFQLPIDKQTLLNLLVLLEEKWAFNLYTHLFNCV